MRRIPVGQVIIALGAALLAALAFTGRSTPVHAAAAFDPASDAADLKLYTEKVVPIFQANCYRCHGGMNHRGGLQMDTRDGLLKGGHDGIVLVPGHPEQSLLVKLIRHEGPANDPMPMPPNRAKIFDADIATVEQWIQAGALIPADIPKP